MSRKSYERRLILKQFREEAMEGSRWNPYKQHTWSNNIYDPSNNKYCGRTPKRWCQLLIYYICLYTGLAILSGICYFVFDLYLPKDVPRYFGHQPGLSVSPCGDDYAKFCRVEYKNTKEIKTIVKEVKHFLEKYGEIPKERFGTCTKEEHYGYPKGEPCIFLKLNRIINFRIKSYDSGDDLPKEAPADLKAHINSLTSEEQKSNRIWFSCKSLTKEITMKYYPQERSIASSSSYVEKNSSYSAKDFERIVAVQFMNFPKNEIVRIHCYLWAKNIVIFDEEGHGAGTVYIRFKINY